MKYIPVTYFGDVLIIREFIRHQRLENSPLTMLNSPANV